MQEAAAVAVADRLYVVGGYDTARNSSSAVFVFNGSRWARAPSLPVGLNHPGATSIGGDIVVAGGFTAGGASRRVFVLAPGASLWREVASMRHARGALALATVDGRAFAVGGRDGTTQVAAVERYDPTRNAWSDIATMPQPRNHVAGYLDAGSVCVAGGRTPATSAAIDCLDVRSGRWRTLTMLATATSGAAAAMIDGALLVAGGEPSAETTVLGIVQHRSAGVWTSEPMLVPRHGTAYAMYHGRFWMCGGANAAGFAAVATCTSLTR